MESFSIPTGVRDLTRSISKPFGLPLFAIIDNRHSNGSYNLYFYIDDFFFQLLHLPPTLTMLPHSKALSSFFLIWKLPWLGPPFGIQNDSIPLTSKLLCGRKAAWAQGILQTFDVNLPGSGKHLQRRHYPSSLLSPSMCAVILKMVECP